MKEFSKFDIARIKFLLAQADKQTYVNLGKGDVELFNKILEVIDKDE